jgi:hypothetical protein
MKRTIVGLLLCCGAHATLIPGPNLAKRVEAADAIIVGKLVRGTVRASGSEVSTDMTLRVDRVLKGDVIPGTEMAAHLEGRGFWLIERATEAPAVPLYGIWFLNSTTRPSTVISRDSRLGPLELAPAFLAEEAPAGKLGDTPAASVANALMASLRWIAEVHGSEITRRETVVSEYWSKFHTCFDDLYTLDQATTLPISKQLATEENIHLRAAGVQGLIAANDPDGVKLAAAHWTELAKSSSAQQIIASLMGYSNAQDPAAIRAVGTLATIEPPPPGLRENASYALRAIHTKEALPALIGLLDSNEERVASNALAGLCLFVRNAPTVTPQSIPSMSWMKTQEPAPYLTAETQPYCSLGGKVSDVERYTGFWKSWWSAHQAEIEGR